MTGALALLLIAAGLSPPRVEHERSREARERIAAGDPAGALGAYAALEREVGQRPEIDVGRGAALLGLGRHAEAGAAFGRAREAPEPLGSRALLGLGNALAAAGDPDGAAAAYREALGRDPAYDDARHNLEVVLQRDEARRPESGQPRPSPDGGQRGEQPAEAERPTPKPGRRTGDPAPSPADESRPSGGGAEAAAHPSRAEAERLLDAVRARERALPAERPTRRRPAERDW